MKFRLWARIGVTLAVNLLLLGLTAGLILKQQSRDGVESILYAPARERIRDLGRLVENEFPGKPDAERTAWLARIQKPYGVTLAVYDDAGNLVAGPNLIVPAAVARQIESQGREDEVRLGTPPDRPNPPIFLVYEDRPSLYWMGYHFPIVLSPERPPARHTLLVVAPTIFGVPLLLDWTPWLMGALAAILATVACWIPLVRRVTRSIGAVRRASSEIAAGKFDVRIPVQGNDEFGDLAHSVKRMAEQLSLLVHGQRRFLADVAHELCAPLSRIQLSAGILAQRASNGDVASIARLERDVAQMSALVGDLLSFTKGTVRKPEIVPVALAPMVDRVVAQESSSEALVTSDVAQGMVAAADPEYLERALSNILRNALRYAGGAGPIRILAESSDGKVRLVVEDCGPGLPEGELDAVFSPFYRPDAVRTPGTGGAGLGLAIVKGCVEACEGTVICRNRKPSGLEVAIELRSCTFSDNRKDVAKN